MNVSLAVEDPNRLPWLADDFQARRRGVPSFLLALAMILTVPLAGGAYWLGMKSAETGTATDTEVAAARATLPAPRPAPMLIDHLNLRPPPQAEPLAAAPSDQTAEPAPRPLSREEVVALRRAKAVASRRLPLDADPQVSALESVGAAQARPPETDASFSCALADSAAKLAVCKNEELVRLDRHLSLFYTQSFVRADGPKRAMLLRTRGKFEAGREACRTDACLRSAYLARILEVEDIVAGSAKPRTETPAKKQVARAKTPAAKKGTQVAARAPQADASFSCSLAKTRGQIGVCKSEGLVKLDQQLSLYYTKSFLNADAARRSKLLSTRERFNTKRDACATNACLTGAYLARIREVADIMEADRATASR